MYIKSPLHAKQRDGSLSLRHICNDCTKTVEISSDYSNPEYCYFIKSQI